MPSTFTNNELPTNCQNQQMPTNCPHQEIPANLPIQALLTTTETASVTQMFFKCAAVASEGGFANDIGRTLSTPEGTVTAASGARTHILSLRPATTFNNFVNRTHCRLENLAVIATGTNPILWELVMGATFSAAPTFAAVNSAYSACQYGTGGTFSALTDGVVIDAGYVGATAQSKGAISQQVSRLFPISLNRSGAVRAMGTVSVLVTGIGGTSAARAVMSFSEVR